MKFIFSFNVQLTDKDLPQKYVFEERDVIFIKEKKEVTKEKVAIFKKYIQSGVSLEVFTV